MTDWSQEAGKLGGAIIFPVLITKSLDKWDKVPLVKGWQKLTTAIPRDHPAWGRANGFGILMGHGFYALDLDSYKPDCTGEKWMKDHGLSGQTRVHKTISGGLHAIYRVPAKHGDLPTRTSIVGGLDGRGSGGFIAFGEGYSLLRCYPAAMMTDSACKAIIDGYSGTREVEVAEFQPIDDDLPLLRKLETLIEVNWRVRARWVGDSILMADKSRSARDMSLAWCLAATGWSAQEIAHVLLNHYQHGQARFLTRGNERAAMRAACKAVASIEEIEAAMSCDVNDVDEEAQREFEKMMFGEDA